MENQSLYKMVQRRLVGSLMYDGENANEVFEIVKPDDLDEPTLELILTAMVQITRKSEKIGPVSVARELENNGQLQQAGGISELYSLLSEGEKYSLEAPIELYAQTVRDSSAKDDITHILEEAKTHFKDDSGVNTVDGVSELQSLLNQKLVGLSNESTVSMVQKNALSYEDLLDERHEVSEANKEHADGLQGIPSLLPTLNKYTHGWTPSQLITCGARTGVGKALAIDTPILTTQGWKNMGSISIDDHVYGRNGLPTKVTNVTDVQHNRKTYQIILSNSETITADADHLWLVKDYVSRMNHNVEQVLTTQEIFDNQKYIDAQGTEQVNYSIALSKSIVNDDKEFLIDPYDYGVALSQGLSAYDHLGLKDDVFNILESYMLGSIKQRKSFISGLLKNEKSDNETVHFSDYTVTSLVKSIFASLGYITFTDYDEDNFAYSITFYHRDNYALKDNNWNVYISEVVEVDSVPVKCIEVDNDEHVYLAGNDLIPTHNSVFAVNNAVAAARAGKSVMFFTLEMSNEEIDDRIIASMSGVSMSKLKEGNLTDEERELVRKSLEELKDMKITVDSDPRVTVDAIRARAFKQAQSPDGLDLIIVDYLQLIAPVGRFSSRQEAVADISRNMKLTAKTLEVPIIVLVQLNRGKGDDDDEDKLPSLDNIRESGAIAMDSDVVILLHRETNHDDTTPHTLVILDKNRNGESKKTIRCHSNLECSLFREVRREKDVSEERLSEDEMSELEADIDLDEFDDFDDDFDMDL